MMRVVFMGSPDFAVPALEAVRTAHEVALVVTQPDKPAGRGKKLAAPAVKVAALAAGLEVAQPKSARDPQFVNTLRATDADIGIVVAYGKILPLAVLEAFPHGCVNIHGSLLPKYRGAAPIQRAVIDGESQTGVTIMKLDEGMDTGPMLLVRTLPIGDNDTAGEVFERLAPLGAKALLDALEQIAAGESVETPQDDSKASHAPMLAKSEGQVDFTRPATVVHNLIRGVDPWPGAYTMLGDKRLKLIGSKIGKDQGRPGEVVAVDSDGMTIACEEGAVTIREVQAPGKKRMSAADFARGHQLAVGTILGTSGSDV
jgi:methionyl-tRNA formyltransferase